MEDDEEKEVEFSNFINFCADTFHCELNISDEKWVEASEPDIHNKILDLVNDVVLGVIGNKILKEIEFQKVDYDLMFVATLRKSLAIATGEEF